ncbi:MAG: hypothetical protein GF331_10950 [Chitinivibrionales bacterium]|nr:hypothetical protein [Chitinivibrionales bacterium]
MRLRTTWWGTLLCVVLLAGCDTEESAAGPGDGRHDGAGNYAYTYNDGVLSLTVDSSYCRGSLLDTVTDTLWGVAVVGDAEMTVTLNDTLSSGTVIVNTRRYERQDTGSSLTGRWLLVSDNNEVLGAAPTEAEVGDWADDTLVLDRMIAQQAYFVEIDETNMVASFTGSLAEVLLPTALADAPPYLYVTLDTAADGRQVTVSGDLSSEVVYIKFNADRDIAVSSSNTSRQSYVLEEVPTSCDNVRQWLDDFYQDNVSFADEFAGETIGDMVEVVDMQIEKLDHYNVRITGNVTGEVIAVVYDGDNTVTYTSSDSSRQEYTSTRRNVNTPDWFVLFCQENLYQSP